MQEHSPNDATPSCLIMILLIHPPLVMLQAALAPMPRLNQVSFLSLFNEKKNPILTVRVAELDIVSSARGEVIGIEHEGTDTILELCWDIVVLVESQGAAWGIGVGVVGGRIGDLVVGLCAKFSIAVAELLGVCATEEHGRSDERNG